MSDLDREIGPIDYLIVEWPKDHQPTGEAIPYLVDLVDRGIIHILDLAIVQKGDDGTIVALNIADFDGDANLSLLVGASSGLLGDDDLAEAGHAIQPGCAAALLVYENSWAGPFAAALRRTGAQLVANGRIPINALVDALDETDK